MPGRFESVHDADFDDHDTVLVIDTVEATRHFMPTRRGFSAVVAGLLALLALVLGVAVVAALRGTGAHAGGLALVTGVALLAGWGAVLFARRALSGRPVLSLTEAGIESPALRAPVAWAELEDAELDHSTGQGVLVLHTRTPAPPPWYRRGAPGTDTARRIGLATLRPLDQQTLFHEIHARLAQQLGPGAVPPSLTRARARQVFEHELDARTPVPWALYAVVGLNVGVWLLTVLAGLSAVRPLPAQLFQWGGNSTWAVVRDHELWRLLSATLLHAGIVHLALNMLSLWQAGRQVSRWFGNAQFLLIYLASAVAGSALSLHFSALRSVSVGASGAVFGVLAAYGVTLARHRDRFPSRATTGVFVSQSLFIGYALLQGFTLPGVDNAAHVGGLVAGALVAWLLADPLTHDARQRLRGQGLAALGTAAVVAALVLTAPPPPLNPRQTFAVLAELSRLTPRLQGAELALQRDTQATREGKLTGTQFVLALEQRHLPAYRANNRLLEPLALPAATAEGQWLRDFKRANVVLAEIMSLQVRKSRGDPDGDEIDAQLATLMSEKDAITARLRAQVPALGASKPGF